jgi:hypothetical protein
MTVLDSRNIVRFVNVIFIALFFRLVILKVYHSAYFYILRLFDYYSVDELIAQYDHHLARHLHGRKLPKKMIMSSGMIHYLEKSRSLCGST